MSQLKQHSRNYKIILTLVLFFLLALLINDMFIQDNVFFESLAIQHKLNLEQNKLDVLKQQNNKLQNLISSLHHHDDTIERQARYNTGMIKQGETFYRFDA